MYLLDTNVLSELPKRAPDPAVVAWLGDQAELAVSAVTVEELVFGIARASPEVSARLKLWFDGLLDLPLIVLPVDAAVARLAGALRGSGEKAGRPRRAG